MRLLAWVLMTNHFHLVLWPTRDGDLSAFMQWATTCHVRRYHRHYKGSGHVWQGRYKCFPIEEGKHLLTVLRYVERNPVRAGMVRKAEEWKYSSASKGVRLRSEAEVPDPFAGGAGIGRGKAERPELALPDPFAIGEDSALKLKGSGTATSRSPTPLAPEPDPFSPDLDAARPLADWLYYGPTPRPDPWLRYVNREEEEELLGRLREAVNRGGPFGSDAWRENAARKLGLESTIKPRGRPRSEQRGQAPERSGGA
jgi:hypothetical protein